MRQGKTSRTEAVGNLEEPVTFNRPFFADSDEMDCANYLNPSRSVGSISVGNYRSEVPKLGISDPNALMPVYYIPIILKDLPPRRAWKDGQYRINPAQPIGAITSFDLRYSWETDLNCSFHTISAYIPQSAFDDLTEELCQPRIESLSCVPSEVCLDPVAYHLALALRPIIDSPETIPSLLVDQILTAMRFHLATRYGGLRLPVISDDHLTPAQVQALKAMLLDIPGRNVRLATLAKACGMPINIFDKAFRKKFGKSPHQWRMATQVEHARKLLECTNTSVADIAIKCGFSDQAHLTRSFLRFTTSTPAAYRRARRD